VHLYSYGIGCYNTHTNKVNDRIVCQRHYSSTRSVSLKLIVVKSYMRYCSSISKPAKVGIELE